jgi:AraC-like DNA-binding protein
MIRTKYSVFDYLPVTDIDQIWGLYVTGSGYADIPPNTTYPPSEHPDGYMFDWQHGRTLQEYQILYITEGSGILETEISGKKKIGEGTIFFLLPGIWHRYMPSKKTGWKEHWISFDGNQPDIFLQTGILSLEKTIIDIGLDEKIIDLYRQILEHIESEKIGFKQIIASLTYEIIARILALEKSKKFVGKEIEATISKAKVLMADRIDQQINFEELASELGIGYSWFRKTFRHNTSLAPAQYFLQLKINKAKDLLVNTSLSVKEIARITGFESQFYFSKFFKKRIGMSPVQLRKFSRSKNQNS